jgi:hypothetical protein
MSGPLQYARPEGYLYGLLSHGARGTWRVICWRCAPSYLPVPSLDRQAVERST